MAGQLTVVLRGVGKRYAGKVALDDVDLTVAAGDCVALLGHNGAGKTTLVKIVLGLTRPSSGQVQVGVSAALDLYSPEWRQRIGYLPENVALDGSATGRELLRFYARLKGCSPFDSDKLLERVGLAADGDRRMRTYSKGMRQRLGLAQALLGQPALLLLDEPTSGLDPVSRKLFYELIAERVAAGATVLISSHSLHEIEGQVSRLALLQQGKMLATGTLDQLRERAQVRTQVRLRVAAGRAGEVARQIGTGATLHKVNDRAIDLSCTNGEKMALLQDVTRLGSVVQDIEIKPPSLEDIYMHLTRGE